MPHKSLFLFQSHLTSWEYLNVNHIYVLCPKVHVLFLGKPASHFHVIVCQIYLTFSVPLMLSQLGRSPTEGNGYPLQCSCLENSKHRRVWQATVHGIIKSWTGLSD